MKTFKLKIILISTCTLLAATSFTDVLNRPKLTPTSLPSKPVSLIDVDRDYELPD